MNKNQITDKLLLSLTASAFAGIFALAQPALAADSSLAKDDEEHIERTVLRYKSAVEVNPNKSEIRLKLGQAYLLSGNLPLALEQFQAASKISPTDSEPYVYISRIYLKQGKDADALKAL